jgi:hypothetical protein
MKDIIHFILCGILSKILDDFYDEDIYKEYFPNVNIFLNFFAGIYVFYLFYFKNTNDAIFIFLFLIELGYIMFLLFKYVGWDDLSKIAEINVTLEDPFTIMALIQLPMFLFTFNKIIRKNYIMLLRLCFGSILFGIIQDVDNSLLGKYVLKNKYSEGSNKKKYKFVYRIGLLLLFAIKLAFLNKYIKINIDVDIFIISYFLTSVVSLYVQIMLEEDKEHKIFIEKLNNIKTQLTQNNILN